MDKQYQVKKANFLSYEKKRGHLSQLVKPDWSSIHVIKTKQPKQLLYMQILNFYNLAEKDIILEPVI